VTKVHERLNVWRENCGWIFQYWKPVRKYLVLLFFFTLLSSAVALGFPLVFRYLLDNVDVVLGTPESSEFTRIIMVLGALAVARLFAGFYPGARGIINSVIGLGVRDDVFRSIMRKDWRFFNAFRPGDLTTRLTEDISEYPRIAWFACSAFFRALESASRLLFCLGVMIFMSWQLSILALAPLPVMLFIFYTVEHRIGKRVEESRKATSHTNDLLDSTFDGIAIVKAYRAEKPLAARLHRLLNMRFGIDLSLTRLEMIIHGVYSMIGQVGKVTVMLAGGIMVIRGRIGLGDFYAFYVYLDMLLAPMMDIPNLFVASRQAFVSVEREREIQNYPEKVEPLLVQRIDAVTEIVMENAGFLYDDAQGVTGLSFKAEAPMVVAVVGEVGAGKSTLLKMLAGLLPVDQGEIRVNGVPRGLADLRETIGYVPQESLLLGESVTDNVRFGRDRVSDNDVEKALIDAGVQTGEFLGSKMLGQRGTGASGGQRQRVAIARALAGKPSLLLLDDCTAALDAGKEAEFWKRFREMESRAIAFVVTHREATVKQCDSVIFIHRGRHSATGTHFELLAENREYSGVIRGMEILEN
jgi:ATP-binding cassette subfamily B protein